MSKTDSKRYALLFCITFLAFLIIALSNAFQDQDWMSWVAVVGFAIASLAYGYVWWQMRSERLQADREKSDPGKN